MSVLYIEPFSGMSGDMFLGALCSLTDGYDDIEKLPENIGLTDGKIEIKSVSKNGIVCRQVKVTDLSETSPNKHGHHHKHRHLKEINKIIENADIEEGAKKIAKEIFLIIGKSEAKIHNIDLEKIHFHEVSGVDSILDIVGCAVLLDRLAVEKTYADPVCTGHGMVKTQHGLLPIPAPATADILQQIPQHKGDEPGEKVTPTGAAIFKYLNPDFHPPVIRSKQIAYGPGEKDFKIPNVLRISVLETNIMEKDAQMYVIESNIDDSSSEYLGSDFQDELMAQGAADFFFTPVQMKKGRPGLKLTVMASPARLENINNFILENTSTIGLRYYPVAKERLLRRNFEIDTKYGPVKVKEVQKPSGHKTRKIEYESLRKLGEKNNISIQLIEKELLHLISNTP